MIKKYDIYDKYHNGMRRTENPDTIIIHGTGGGQNARAFFKWVLGDNFERATQYRGGEGFPYLIDVNGDVYELADPASVWQYHSGTGGRDKKTIGIELINTSAGNLSGYTTGQYGELLKLICDKLLKYFPVTSIVGHGAFQKSATGKGKVCPGPKFQWEILANELTSRGYKFKTSSEKIYDITEG